MELSAPQGDGASLRTHLQRLAENTKKIDDRLNVEWPARGRELWGIFTSLGRPPSMSGAARITQQEILAWQQNHGIRLTPWELEIIELFDGIVIDAWSRKSSKGTDKT